MVSHSSNIENTVVPACSICIANYNGEQLIAQCIESILNQENFSSEFEIIIHDDASTDSSVDFIRTRYPEVRLLLSNQNVGFCVSNNRMVAAAQGEFILLLNNDTALWPDALATLLDHARTQASRGILTLPQYDWQTGELVDRGCMLDPFYNPVPNLNPFCYDVAMVIGACLWIPRGLWFELGGLPEWMESIGEDIFLCCRARLGGYPVQVTDTSGYRHFQGKSFGGNRAEHGHLISTYRRRALSERNKIYVIVVLTPSVFMWPLLILNVLFLGMEGGLLSLVRWDWRIWRDIYLNAIHNLLAKSIFFKHLRYGVQNTRRCSLSDYFRTFTLMPRKLVLLFRYGIPSVQ